MAKLCAIFFGALGGALIAGVIIAWRYHPALDIVVALPTGVALWWAVPRLLPSAFGSESVLLQSDKAPDLATIIIRFICGGLVGAFFGFRVAWALARSDAIFIILWCVITVGCGYWPLSSVTVSGCGDEGCTRSEQFVGGNGRKRPSLHSDVERSPTVSEMGLEKA